MNSFQKRMAGEVGETSQGLVSLWLIGKIGTQHPTSEKIEENEKVEETSQRLVSLWLIE